MEPVRPLRDVFAGLADHAAGADDAGPSAPDSRSFLADHQDLPDDLLVTAIGSYANTAPAEVAEHLAEFVAEPGADLGTGLDLLASAPVGDWQGEVPLADLDDLDAFDNEDGDSGDGDSGDGPGLGGDPGLYLDDLDRVDHLDQAGTDPTATHPTEDTFGHGDNTEAGDTIGDGDTVEDDVVDHTGEELDHLGFHPDPLQHQDVDSHGSDHPADHDLADPDDLHDLHDLHDLDDGSDFNDFDD